MKAVRLHAYQEPLRVDDVAEPTITGPHDVVVRVAGAGLCRTDVHIRDGWFAPAVPADLPLTLGHETTGWVHEVGPAVGHVAVGDAVICHPQQSCGVCAACRTGDDMRCAAGLTFNGLATREIEVLRLVADGCDTHEIADKLAYSERTVKNVLHDVTTRLQLRNRSHAVAYALRQGLI